VLVWSSDIHTYLIVYIAEFFQEYQICKYEQNIKTSWNILYFVMALRIPSDIKCWHIRTHLLLLRCSCCCCFFSGLWGVHKFCWQYKLELLECSSFGHARLSFWQLFSQKFLATFFRYFYRRFRKQGTPLNSPLL